MFPGFSILVDVTIRTQCRGGGGVVSHGGSGWAKPGGPMLASPERRLLTAPSPLS